MMSATTLSTTAPPSAVATRAPIASDSRRVNRNPDAKMHSAINFNTVAATYDDAIGRDIGAFDDGAMYRCVVSPVIARDGLVVGVVGAGK